MATRQFYYAESTAESTDLDTTGAYADKATLSFTPDASSTYYLIASWFMQQLTSTIRYVGGTFIESGTPTTYQEILHDGHDTTADYYAGGGIGIFTEGGSPASRTFKIQVKGENAAVSEKIKNARIVAIKKDSADQHVEQTTRQTTTSGSYGDVSGASLTFSPATQGDYIILAVAQYDVSATSDIGIRIDIDGSPYGAIVGRVQDTALNKYPYYFVKRVNLTAASHTIKMQFQSNGSATLGVDEIRIIALRADTFDANYYDEETTRQTTTSTTYTDTNVSITQTPANKAHLFLASGVIDSNSATQNMGLKLVVGGSDIGELYMEPKATTNVYPFFAMYQATLAASSATWKLQVRAETSNTVGYDEAALSVIQLEASGSGVTVNPSALSATFSIQSPTVSTTRNVSVSPAAQSVTFSIQAPTITAIRNLSTSPAVQSASFSVQAPSITVSETNSPTTQSASFSIQAPTVSTVRNVTTSPNAQSATFSIQAPNIIANRSVSTSPTAQSAVFSIQSPTVTAVRNLTTSPSTQSAAFSVQAPVVTVIRSVTASPSALTATFSVLAPTVTIGASVTVSPSALAATINLLAPTVTVVRNLTFQQPTLSATFSILPPTVSANRGVVVSLDVLSLSFSIVAPSVVVPDVFPLGLGLNNFRDLRGVKPDGGVSALGFPEQRSFSSNNKPGASIRPSDKPTGITISAKDKPMRA